MLYYKKKKVKQIVFLFLIGITISFMNFNQLFWNSNNSITDSDSSTESQEFNEIKTSGYSSSYSGTGMNMSMTLHQSYLNTSFNTDYNASDPSNRTINVPCPTDYTFNSSFTNITIIDIYAPNKTIEAETSTSLSTSFSTNTYFFGFQVYSDCVLENFSLCFSEIWGGSSTDGTVDIRIYSGKWESGNNVPDTQVADLGDTTVPDGSSAVWINVDNVDYSIDQDNTDNSTFYLQISQSSLPSNTEVQFHHGDNTGNDVMVWRWTGVWTEITVDPAFKLYYSLADNTPNATAINLKINGTTVDAIDTDNTGAFTVQNQQYTDSDGILDFEITAGWWDLTCKVTQVQINYTKTDLEANSEFNIAGSGLNVDWTVTAGNLDHFNSTFEQYWINFTVPTKWSNFQAFNDTGNLIDETRLGPPKDSYTEYQIYNASNGPNWYITAESLNLVDNISFFVDSFKTYTVNYTNTIDIIGNFTEIIKNGNVTIEIYSPDDTGNYLNHTNYNSSINTALDYVPIGNWKINDTAEDYGVFITRMDWSNGTAAGFLIGNLIILGESDMIPELPKDIFYANEIFNITVKFNDTGQEKPIIGGNISYSIEGSPFTTENVTDLLDGNYTITIDCNDTKFGEYGLKTVEIYANQTFFNNQSRIVQFTIYGNTTLNYENFVNNSFYDSSQQCNITIEFYDEINKTGIDGAYINYSLNGGLDYRYNNVYPYLDGSGKYNITINCNDSIFNDYGPQIIIVNVSKPFYENQTIILGITITGDTELTYIKLPDQSFYYSDEVLNITAHFNDTARNIGIDGANVQIYVKNATSGFYDLYSTNIIPEGNGDYNIFINCSDSIFDRYGWFDLKINASKPNYYTSSSVSLDLIIGNTSLILIDPSENSVFVKGEIFNITVQYYDVVKNEGIIGANINYTLDGNNYRYDNFTPIGNGRYIITIYANDSDFGDIYGFRTIQINASKQYYKNLTYHFTFHRQMTTEISPSNTANLGPVIRGLNVSYTFNYSETDEDYITKASWELVSDSYNFIPFLESADNGTYTMHLDTTNVNVSYSPFNYIFNISAIGNETQVISLNIEVTIIQTQIKNIVGTELIARNSELNQTINFYFNDTINELPVLGLTSSDIIVKNYGTGTVWDTGDFNWKLIDLTGGNYRLNISLGTGISNRINSGWYTLELNVSKAPNYNWSLAYYQFYLRGNYSQINMISVSDHEQLLTPSGMGYNYTTFLGSDLSIEFNITDDENNNKVVIGDADGYLITFKNLGTGFIGTLQETLYFDLITSDYGIHLGNILSSQLAEAGNYLINITVIKLNYENTTSSLNLTLVNSQINMISISNPGGQLTPTGIGNYYSSSVALDIYLEFNITDTESLGRLIARDATLYTVRYTNLGTTANGIIQNTFTFNSLTSIYDGTLISSGLPVGDYLINISVEILNYKINSLTFNLTIVYANSNLLSIANPGGQISPSIIDNFYDTFIGSNITIGFNILDANFGNVIQIGTGISYIISYQNIDTLETGSLQHDITELTSSHSGSLNISQLTTGNYTFFITIQKSGNTVSTLNFKVRIIEKYEIRITTINPPEEIIAGDSFYLILKVEYYNGSWITLVGTNVIITPYYDGTAASPTAPLLTNSTGEVRFEITVPSDARNMTLIVEIQETYNYLSDSLEISNILVKAPPSGLEFEDLLPYLLIIGAAVAAAGGSFAVYRGVIVPKKREKTRILTEVKTIFDDAISLEHILVLYKGTGTCIYFKSFGSEQIDPELISGFISAISSFGKDLVSQEELNEISYGDKMLLLSDGEYIRVALVLSKKASLILRRNLMEFIRGFESAYTEDLPKWRGQLNIFRDAGIIIDEILSTSIILPHEITYEYSSVKNLKRSQSREVIKIADTLMKDSERNFFFIATLLKEATEKTGKDTAEIFMGIKELRDTKILMPIEISTIEKKPISQQEMNLINQKVGTFVNLSPEERQKLVNDLAQMGPAEREAYFVSLTEQHEIVSAPIESRPGAAVIETTKAAKKEIKNLKKNAKEAKKEKDYEKCMKIYQNAAKIALSWELVNESQEIDDIMRLTKIEDLTIKMKNLENEAKNAVKKENFNEASQKYKVSSKIASEIFKLGVDDMTKEVKRLTNKAKEYEKKV